MPDDLPTATSVCALENGLVILTILNRNNEPEGVLEEYIFTPEQARITARNLVLAADHIEDKPDCDCDEDFSDPLSLLEDTVEAANVQSWYVTDSGDKSIYIYAENENKEYVGIAMLPEQAQDLIDDIDRAIQRSYDSAEPDASAYPEEAEPTKSTDEALIGATQFLVKPLQETLKRVETELAALNARVVMVELRTANIPNGIQPQPYQPPYQPPTYPFWGPVISHTIGSAPRLDSPQSND